MGNSESSLAAIKVVAVAGAATVALTAWSFASSSRSTSVGQEPEESYNLQVVEVLEDDQVLPDLSLDEAVELVVDNGDDYIAGGDPEPDSGVHGGEL